MNRVYTFSGEIPQPIPRLGEQITLKFSCDVLITGNEGPSGELLDGNAQLQNITFAKNYLGVDIELKVEPNATEDALSAPIVKTSFLRSTVLNSYTHYATFVVHSPFYNTNYDILNAYYGVVPDTPMAAIGTNRYEIDFYINTNSRRVGWYTSDERKEYAKQRPRSLFEEDNEHLYTQMYNKLPQAGYVSELVLRLQTANIGVGVFSDNIGVQPRLVPTKIGFISSASTTPIPDGLPNSTPDLAASTPAQPPSTSPAANLTTSQVIASSTQSNMPWTFIVGSVAVCAGTYVLLR